MQSSRSKQFFFIFQWGTLDKLPQRGEVGVVGVGVGGLSGWFLGWLGEECACGRVMK